MRKLKYTYKICNNAKKKNRIRLREEKRSKRCENRCSNVNTVFRIGRLFGVVVHKQFLGAVALIGISLIIVLCIYIDDVHKVNKEQDLIIEELEGKLLDAECRLPEVDSVKSLSERIDELQVIADTYQNYDNYITAIGTEYEEDVWGYNFTKVVEVVYQEGGGHSYELVWGVATAIYNTVLIKEEEDGIVWTPEDVVENYGYTEGKGSYNSIALKACLEVFLRHRLFVPVEDSTLFYNSELIGYNEFHEQHECVWVSEEGVKFFRE